MSVFDGPKKEAIAACKSDGSYREHEKAAGEEVEAQDEHGDTALDDADEADEYESERKQSVSVSTKLRPRGHTL